MKIRKTKKRLKKQGYLTWKEYAIISARFFRMEGTKFPYIKYTRQLTEEDKYRS